MGVTSLINSGSAPVDEKYGRGGKSIYLAINYYVVDACLIPAARGASHRRPSNFPHIVYIGERIAAYAVEML